jgi:uncharacterized protein
MSTIAITERNGCVRFTVRVQPRASSAGVAGAHGDALRVRLQSPPVDGAANDELVPLLARAFAVKERDVRIVSGAHSRTKVVEIQGIAGAAVMRIADAMPVTEKG